MPHADFELGADGTLNISGHGGRREGAGRKPKDYEPSAEKVSFDKEKALHEKVKRERAELALKVEAGKLVQRAAVQQAAAAALAMFAQSMRSLPDTIERKLHVSPEVTEEIEKTIDAALDDLAGAFELMHTPDTR